MSKLKTEMQTRCPHCLGEIYGPAVYSFSYGKVSCHNCGQFSKPMNTDEYLETLRLKREENERP